MQELYIVVIQSHHIHEPYFIVVLTLLFVCVLYVVCICIHHQALLFFSTPFSLFMTEEEIYCLLIFSRWP